jgi:hypothetical protein
MKESDVLKKQGFPETNNGTNGLYIWARLKCAVGNHVVEQTFTLTEWEAEIRNPESWTCPEHV